MPPRRRALITAAVALGVLLSALDFRVVGTAMPTVIASLGGMSLYSWVFAAYALSTTAAVPILGRLSDLHGRKGLYLGGLALFVFASALGGMSRHMGQLIAFRALQGIGGAALSALSFTIVGDLYPPERRGRVQGLMSAMWALAAVVGPALSATIVATMGWRWVFFVNMPISLLPLAILSLAFQEPAPQARGEGVDYPGVATLVGAVLALMIASTLAGEGWDWRSPPLLALVAGSAFLLAAFIHVQRRTPVPTLPLELFRQRMFALGVAGNFLLGAIIFSLGAFIPLFAQGVLGAGVAGAGAAFTAMSLGWAVAAAISGLLARPLGYRRLSMAGFAFTSAAFYLLMRLTVDSTLSEVLVAMALGGLGAGTIATTLLLALQNTVERSQLGLATSLAMFFQNIGGALGVSIGGSFQATRVQQWFGGPAPDPAELMLPAEVARLSPALLASLKRALAQSLRDVFVAGLFIALLGLALSAFMTGWRQELPKPAAPIDNRF